MFDPAPRRRHHPFRMKMLRARHQDPTAPKLRLRKLGAHSWTEAITRPPRSACLQLSRGPWDEPPRRQDEPPVEAGSTWVPLEIEICIVSAPGDISHGALAGLPRRGTLVTAEHAEGSGCQGPASPRHYRGRSAVAIKDLRPLEPELRRGTVNKGPHDRWPTIPAPSSRPGGARLGRESGDGTCKAAGATCAAGDTWPTCCAAWGSRS